MQRFQFLTLVTCVALLLGVSISVPAQIPQTMSYQGVLTDGAGTPVGDGSYSLTFKIYTVGSGGTGIWAEAQSVQVSGGIFSVILGAVNPLTVPFDVPYWLSLSVNGGPEYTPRTELTSTGYSLNSRAVADSAVTGSGIASGTVVRSLSGLTDHVILGAGSNVSITTSGDSLIISSSGGSGSLDWSLTGNAGTTPGVNFLGTTDNQPFELWVNSARALRLEPNGTSPNVVGGRFDNAVTAGAFGAVISGGGESLNPNTVTDHHGTVGGGRNNVAGDSDGDPTTAIEATVGGGSSNTAVAWGATVGGGQVNTASGLNSTVAGGINNQASAVGASVPGGENNIGGGTYSFAAGRGAQALHGGSFVWSDSTGDNGSNTLTTTAPDQFLIRAGGGVGIGTNTPQQELDVAGSVRMQGFDLPTGAATGYVLTSDLTGQGTWQPAPGGSAWGLTGNSGTNPVNDYLGTSDNVALELRVNNARAFTLQPHATSPNIVGGHSANTVNAGAWGQTVGGGGETIKGNRVTDIYGTVGGGVENQAGNNDGSPTNAGYATVGGGAVNSASDQYSFVGGGADNTARGSYSVISGGTNNLTTNLNAVIGGGEGNQVDGTTSVVSGGLNNQAMSNYTTVGGGNSNVASGIYATAGGGFSVTASGERATVSGGSNNLAIARGTTIGGGEANQANERSATVGGGWSNTVHGVLGTIAGGGRTNLTDQLTANRVTDNYGTVGGGGNNQAGNGEVLITDAQYATVAGGRNNTAEGAQSTVAGGNGNAARASNATVAGGNGNNALASAATVGGGSSNLANAGNATIAGGGQNQATDTFATVSGGGENQANGSYSLVGGGRFNVVDGSFSAILGGHTNSVASSFSFAAGRRAKVGVGHTGTFLYADGLDFDFNSAASFEFAARATGGVRFVSAIDGAGTPTAGVTLASGGGAWATLSDRDAKENITPVDGDEILLKLSEIPISTWNYRTQHASILHMGPMAQDFYAAFELGEDDKHITTIDADGVSLAAIQALNRKLAREVDKKDAQIAALEARMAILEAMVNRMAGAPIVTQ